MRDPYSKLVAASSSHLFKHLVQMVELHVAWIGIIYAVDAFQADRLVVEDDYSMVVDMIRSLIHPINRLVRLESAMPFPLLFLLPSAFIPPKEDFFFSIPRAQV